MAQALKTIESKTSDRSFIPRSKADVARLLFGKSVGLLHLLAPSTAARLVRKYGFRAARFTPNAEQRRLVGESKRVDVTLGRERLSVFSWAPKGVSPKGRALLIHGWASSGLQLSPFVQPLLDEGYEVVTFDQKGHGLSSSTFSSYIEFLRGTKAVSEHFDGKFDIVIGHSMGASVAMKVFAENPKTRSVIAIAPMLEVYSVLSDLCDKTGLPVAVMKSVVKEIEREGELLLQDASGFDFDRLGKQRVLLVHDQDDRVNPYTRSEELSAALPQAKIFATKGLGHNRILKSDVTIQRVIDFLRESL